MLTDHEATHVMRALDALDELEAAAVELACGPAIDGLIADPLTAGTRLDVVCLVDTIAADLLAAMGRGETVRRLVDEAPAGGARDALVEYLADQGST